MPPTWSTRTGSADGRGPWEPVGPLRRGRGLVAIAAVVVLLVAGVVGAIVLLDRPDDGDGTASPEPPPGVTGEDPSEAEDQPGATTTTEQVPASPGGRAALEASVADLSAFVEGVRGAPFPAPVQVELLEGQAFNERLLADFEEERDDLDLVGRIFVAMQLLDRDDDLYEIFREFLGVGVLGFYDAETGELVVRGAAITPYTQSTIVHELTHAHDDQRFELDRPALQDASDESALGFAALVEGNATRVQELWEATLSDEDRDALLAEQLDAVTGVDLGDVPLVLLRQIDFPYTSGPALVEALAEAGGEARVDAAFDAPPTTSEQVVEPDLYLDAERPLPVEAPAADGEVIDEGTYGMLTLGITLGDALDQETARQAAEGWGGDAYVVWAEQEQTCLRAAFRMDTADDLAELTDAWEAWAQEHPDADVEEGDGTVTVTACG